MIWSGLAAAVIVVAVAGCSSTKRRQVVSGTVSHGGLPLPPCFIHFHGPDGLLTTVPVGSDGKFMMTDVFPGEYKVSLHLRVEKGGSKKNPHRPPPAPPIPDKYLSVETTDLVYRITPDTGPLTIELQ
jgi:hypothetical protein